MFAKVTRCKTPPRNETGYALLVTLGFLGIMLILLASVVAWTSNESGMTARNNLYNSSVAAAEAATEMVIAQMDRDFVYQSVNADLDQYRNLTPGPLQGDWPVTFEFSDGSGNAGQTGVISLGPAVVTNLNSQFAGLYGLVAPYRVTAQARALNQLYNASAAVCQDIQLASLPVFQFAIFYTMNLEINPGPAMIITGKVHSNGNIYTAPVSNLEYRDYVTYSGAIFNNRDPSDPQYGSAKVAPVYVHSTSNPAQAGGLTLPVGVDNSPASVQQILEPPPFGEDPDSQLGQQRYYNKADLIVTTTNGAVRVTTGAWDNFAPVAADVTNGSVTSYSFLDTSKSFIDYRENKTTITTEIDVGAFKSWMAVPNKGGALNGLVQSLTGHQLDSVYVQDQRLSPGKLTVVRVVNGAALPANGLTVATKLPLYVKGNFNLNNGDTSAGQTNTSKTKPASLAGDAITILSQNWKDDYLANSTASGRGAANTTVNAALLSGIVPTCTNHYSGGVENFPRFLENWNNLALTYNGSMVVMFNSRYATNFWKSPDNNNYYTAPDRRWAFDVNFLDQAKLPPGTPQVRKLVRGQWNIVGASGG